MPGCYILPYTCLTTEFIIICRESLDKDRVTTPLSPLVALGLFLTSGAISIAGAPLLTIQRRNTCTVWLHVEEQHENNLSRFPKTQEVVITC